MKKTSATFFLTSAQRFTAVNALSNHASESTVKSYRQRLRQILDRIETADYKMADVKLTAAQADAFYDFADNMAFDSKEQGASYYRVWIKIRKAVGSSIGRKASRLDAVGHAKPLVETITKDDVADLTTRQLIAEYEKAETAFQLIMNIGHHSASQSFRASANDLSCSILRDVYARIPALKSLSVVKGEAVLIIKN
jgi:site-specific recombinase XerD